MAHLKKKGELALKMNVLGFSELFCLLRMFWKDTFPMFCWLNVLKRLYMYFPFHQIMYINPVYKVKVHHSHSHSEIYFKSCGDAQHATDVFKT